MLALVNAGCAEVFQRPQAWNTLERNDRRESFICGLTVDRTGTGGITLEFSMDPEGGVLAGFKTSFAPGNPPFACDRLHQTTAQGVFRFDVRTIPGVDAGNYIGAILEVESSPREPIRVVYGEPWDLGLGQGWLSSSAPVERCPFKVSVAAGSWETAEWGGPTVGVTALRSGSGLFDAPGPMRTFIVTDEVGEWLRGQPETGFVITPASSAINSKSNSTCVVLFAVRLRVLVRDGGG